MPQRQEPETTLTLGTPLTIKQSLIKEKILNPNHQLEENPPNLETSSSSSQEDTEEEELLSLNPLHQEIS